MHGRPAVELAPFVSPEWLADHVDEVVFADVRAPRAGIDLRARYVAGHLPGAVFVDLDADLAAPPSREGGRHPLPTPEAFADAMARLGISDSDTVIAYDESNGAFAARLVWMLRVIGHAAAVLDGGLAAWRGRTETDIVERPAATFTPTPWPADAIVDADTVGRLAQRPQAAVVDARAAERYRGEVEPFDPVAGHIPGAINLPFTGNLDGDRVRPVAELRERFADLAGRDVAVYCGSGVTACHDVLAIEHAGLPRPRLFVGSWSAWCGDPHRPVATGEGG